MSWDQMERQLFEVQEYLGYCPALLDPKRAAPQGLGGSCSPFKVYVYPASEAQLAKMSTIYRNVRRIVMDSPYATADPAEACLFIPNVDTSCWCAAAGRAVWQHTLSLY